SDTAQAVQSMTLLPSRLEAPAWIGGEGPFDAALALPAKNGLVYLPAAAAALEDGGAGKVLIQPTPRDFGTYSLTFPLHPGAPEPVDWLKFLGSVWPGDQQSVDALQEWFGYLLSPNTSLQKMAWLIGPSRSGRGTIGRVLTALLGAENVA